MSQIAVERNVSSVMEIEVMSEKTATNRLPEGWRWEALGEVADNLDNKRKPINAAERETRQGDVPYYGATGQVGWIDKHLLDEEVVLVGEDGAPFLEPGRAKAYMISGKSWVNNHAHVLRAKDGMPNAYLMHFLNILDYSPYVSGTTRLKLTKGAMAKIPVPVAPLPQQRRIVSAIELQLGRLDAAVARLHGAKAKLKRYKQAVLKAALKGDYDEVSLAEVCDKITDGEHQTPKRTSMGRMMLTAKNIRDGYIAYDDYDHVSAEDFGRSRKRCDPAPGDVLLVCVGATIGRSALVVAEQEFILVRSVAQIRPGKDLIPEYLRICIQSEAVQKQIGVVKRGSAQPSLFLGMIKALTIPLPSRKRQEQIVNVAHAQLDATKDIEATLDAQLEQSTRLRQAVLKRAFEGRLVT